MRISINKSVVPICWFQLSFKAVWVKLPAHVLGIHTTEKVQVASFHFLDPSCSQLFYQSCSISETDYRRFKAPNYLLSFWLDYLSINIANKGPVVSELYSLTWIRSALLKLLDGDVTTSMKDMLPLPSSRSSAKITSSRSLKSKFYMFTTMLSFKFLWLPMWVTPYKVCPLYCPTTLNFYVL